MLLIFLKWSQGAKKRKKEKRVGMKGRDIYGPGLSDNKLEPSCYSVPLSIILRGQDHICESRAEIMKGLEW